MSNKKEDLRIEFRAVPYATGSIFHAVQYRLCPEQDLTYYTHLNFGLFKIKIKRKYSTKWVEPIHFSNHAIAYMYPEEENYTPFLINDRHEMCNFTRFKTLGEFSKYLDELNASEISKWKVQRENYFRKREIWY